MEVRKEVLEAILKAARQGESPCVEFSKDPLTFAKRAAAQSMERCGKIATMVEAVLSGPVEDADAINHRYDELIKAAKMFVDVSKDDVPWWLDDAYEAIEKALDR